jgi:hypothetical protein
VTDGSRSRGTERSPAAFGDDIRQRRRAFHNAVANI